MNHKVLKLHGNLFICNKQIKGFIGKYSLFTIALSLFLLPPFVANAKGQNDLSQKSFLPGQVHAISTVPANGDLNPYGVAFVPERFPPGIIKTGDILVSNFNNNQNLQGTGSTIVDIASDGSSKVFFQGSGLLGLTAALNVLKKGLVLVGNFPSTDGTCTNAQNGSILVINNKGELLQSLIDPDFINGPWDSALVDQGRTAILFVANGLTGAVVRFNLAVGTNSITVVDKTQIASGYQHQCDPVTFVDAPTGLVYDRTKDVLYVSSTMDNVIYAVPHAMSTKNDNGRGNEIFSSKKYLHGALAMTMAPNGDLIVSNNDAINPSPKNFSALTEFTPLGKFVKEITVDANAGGAFGLNIETNADYNRLAAVDDNQNLLLIWKLPKY